FRDETARGGLDEAVAESTGQQGREESRGRGDLCGEQHGGRGEDGCGGERDRDRQPGRHPLGEWRSQCGGGVEGAHRQADGGRRDVEVGLEGGGQCADGEPGHHGRGRGERGCDDAGPVPCGAHAGNQVPSTTRPNCTSAKWMPKPSTSGAVSSPIRRRREATASAGSWSDAAESSGWAIWTGECSASPKAINRRPLELST